MNILRKNTKTLYALQTWATNKKATQEFIDNAAIYLSICAEVGVNAEVAYAQYAKESGYGKHNGTVPASYKNPCGLKTSSGGSDTDKNAHKQFSSWQDGIQAHIDHLALYAGQDGYPKKDSPDPRHFTYLFGKCKTVESLVGNWCSDKSYATDINKLVNEIRACEDKEEKTATKTVTCSGNIKECKVDGKKVTITYYK
jgi:hypothetical protein